jgi:restriction endonuclease Mrr
MAKLSRGLMIDYNVGVSERETYPVKRVDGDYFGDEEALA